MLLPNYRANDFYTFDESAIITDYRSLKLYIMSVGMECIIVFTFISATIVGRYYWKWFGDGKQLKNIKRAEVSSSEYTSTDSSSSSFLYNYNFPKTPGAPF